MGRAVNAGTAKPVWNGTGVRVAMPRRLATPPFFIGFVAPAVLLTILFTVYPMVRSLGLAFQDWDGAGRATFTGLKNLQELASDQQARAALGRTLVYTAG